MAALPPRSQPRQRINPADAESTSRTHLPRTSSEAITPVSEHSQTLLLSSSSRDTQDTAQAERTGTRGIQDAAETEEPRKCWVCYSDETEDTPISSEWRSPCPCALVAHESCLLDWIADLESPTARSRAGKAVRIRCPQCKSDIRLARPVDVVVSVVRVLERLGRLWTIPAALAVVTATIHSVAMVHGSASIYAVFGHEDAMKILHPVSMGVSSAAGFGKWIQQYGRLQLSVPLIPVLLVLSRTTMADHFLPIVPVVFLATTARPDELLRIKWPPSAALSFALLPYIRCAYNTYYDLMWSKREKEWLKEIKPRSTSSDESAEEVAPAADDGDGMGIGIELDIIDEAWEGPLPPPEPLGDDQVAPLIEAEATDAAAAAAGGNGGGGQVHQHHHHRQAGEIQLAPFVGNVLGALVFPGVAAAMGQLLKVTLPRSLTTVGSSRSGGAWWTSGRISPIGLLQTRWGRSLVGGCLFVALKDAVMLYVRWKMAVNHRHRRVLDYDKASSKTAVRGGRGR